MVRHMIDIVVLTITKSNGDKITVITCDQPLYVGKQLQWRFPDKYGEDRNHDGWASHRMMVIN